jgi:SAM-dependent methyltransferase
MPSPSDLLRVTPYDTDYLRLARLEAEFWSAPHPYGLESLEKTQRLDGPVDRYTNARFTGDPGVPWEATICRHGDFRRGILLGTSMLAVEARILATNPRLHLTVVDLSKGALARRAEVLGGRFPGRVDTMVADLNFLDLDPGRYDVVVSSASLHHVTNLEYLGHQINQTLAPGGWFFLQDYVGEPRFQFSDEKRRVFAELYAHEASRYRGRRPELRWNDTADLSPFCGVRSHEVLSALRGQLTQVSVLTAGSLTVPLLRSRPVDGEWPNPRSPLRRVLEAAERGLCRLRGVLPRGRVPLRADFLRQLMIVGDALTDSGVLAPGNAFAVYRKR